MLNHIKTLHLRGGPSPTDWWVLKGILQQQLKAIIHGFFSFVIYPCCLFHCVCVCVCCLFSCYNKFSVMSHLIQSQHGVVKTEHKELYLNKKMFNDQLFNSLLEANVLKSALCNLWSGWVKMEGCWCTTLLHPVQLNAGLCQNVAEWAQPSAVPLLRCLRSNPKHTCEQLAGNEERT